MKKILKDIFIIIVISYIIIAFLYTSVYASTTDHSAEVTKGIAKLDGCKIVAWQLVYNTNITLDNGKMVAYMGNDRNIEVNTINAPVDICFELDCSGSMADGRIDNLKIATKKLISNLREKFSDPSKLRVALVPFETDVIYNQVQGFVDCSEENYQTIYTNIDNLTTYNLTNTGKAVNYAENNIWKNSNSLSNCVKYNIIVTDGRPEDGETNGTAAEKARQSIINFRKDLTNINFATLFISPDNDVLSTLSSIFEVEGATIMYASDSDFSKDFVENIYRYIVYYMISLDEIVESKNTSNFMRLEKDGGKKYVSQIDSELLQGATLNIEYQFTINTIENLKKVEIIDYIPDGFVLNKDGRIYVESENGMYKNGKYLDGNYECTWEAGSSDGKKTIATYNSDSQSSDSPFPFDAGETYGKGKNIDIYVSMSKLLTSGVNSYEYNMADIIVTTEDGKKYQTENSNIDLTTTNGIKDAVQVNDGQIMYSPQINIIPPTGGIDNTKKYIMLLIECTIMLSVIIFLKIKSTSKKNNKHHKHKNKN